jgi:hypothetical protein
LPWASTLDAVGRERPERLLELALEVTEEVLREQRHVLDPLAERGDAHREDAQPIVEICPEAPRRHVGLQVAIGRRDEARVRVDGRPSAHALELPLLEDAQQLHLYVRR